MKINNPKLTVLVCALAAFALSLITATADSQTTSSTTRHSKTVPISGPVPAQSPAPPSQVTEETIREREKVRRGITVDEPRVYDDAMLQQMLRVAEARLAQLQLIDQTSIASRLGATTGASQQISSFGLNVQGLPLPQVVTTAKGATGTTTETDQTAGTTSGSQTIAPTGTTTQSGFTTGTTGTVQTVSGLATQDVVTTRGQFGPPGATAPSPTTTLPSAGFSVSSSDILNEQMQLTAEINGLRLMLAGDLSGHFSRRNTSVTKVKTTLGFPITVTTDERFKDRVAVVEVEVERSRPAEASNTNDTEGDEESEDAASDPGETPMITALLPREKTYNVAAITDKSVSIGGGVATQIVGISGSWLRGHKTHYLVQDQDTVALTFQPANPKRVGFMWEFRPVLGQRYVKSGLKQTFVQIAFDAPRGAEEGEIGKVTVRTYWRDYDRKRGIHKDIVADSLSGDRTFEIPHYNLAVRPPSFNSNNLEDIGDGQVLVNLKGRYLPGTYVRIGSELISALPRLLHEHQSFRFVAPIASLATKDVYLVAHDGTEVALKLRGCGLKDDGLTTLQFVPNGDPTITAADEANSLVKVKFSIQETTRTRGAPMVLRKDPGDAQIGGLIMIVGGRVFGFSDLKRKGNELSVVVPTAALVANPEISIQKLFPKRGCRPDPTPVADFIPAKQSERLVILEQTPRATKFLLFGRGLDKMDVLSPLNPKPRLELIGPASESSKMRSITLTAAQLQSNKQILLQRGNEKPFLVTIPESEGKKEPPKAKETVPVGANEANVEGGGMKDLEKVTFRGKNVEFDVIDDTTVRLKGLQALGATSTEMTQRFEFKFKSEAKLKKVEIRVVRAKFEVQ